MSPWFPAIFLVSFFVSVFSFFTYYVSEMPGLNPPRTREQSERNFRIMVIIMVVSSTVGIGAMALGFLLTVL